MDCQIATRGHEVPAPMSAALVPTRPSPTPRCDGARTASALQQEFFGGIWYKIFSERGPCASTPAT